MNGSHTSLSTGTGVTIVGPPPGKAPGVAGKHIPLSVPPGTGTVSAMTGSLDIARAIGPVVVPRGPLPCIPTFHSPNKVNSLVLGNVNVVILSSSAGPNTGVVPLFHGTASAECSPWSILEWGTPPSEGVSSSGGGTSGGGHYPSVKYVEISVEEARVVWPWCNTDSNGVSK